MRDGSVSGRRKLYTGLREFHYEFDVEHCRLGIQLSTYASYASHRTREMSGQFPGMK